MLTDLASVEVDCVVVLNTSRLWRSDMAKVLIQRKLKRHRVDVRAIEQQTYSIYNDDPNDFLVNGMLELLDQYQRLEIALKLSRGRRKKAEQGGYAGGGAAFGYNTAKGQKALHIEPAQANTVKRLFELRQRFPAWTLKQIASQLNQEGFRTRQGSQFRKVQVKRILDHESTYRNTDEMICSTCGESLGAIWLRKGSVDEELLNKIRPEAQREVMGLIEPTSKDTGK